MASATLKAPEWYRNASGPGGLRPRPPQVMGAWEASSTGTASSAARQGGSTALVLPAVPPPPPAHSGSGVDGGSTTALALPQPPDLAPLPPPPGPGNTQLALTAGGSSPSTLAVALPRERTGTKASVTSAPKGGGHEQVFMIPGLQARAFSEEELELAFEMMDLDRHGFLKATEIRRTLALCGEPEPTDAEIDEMMRLMHSDASGTIEFREFAKHFMDPPAVFRNFDLRCRDVADDTFSTASPLSSIPASRAVTAEEPGMALQSRLATAFAARADAIVEMLGPHGAGLKPEFIKDIYQRFVETDKDETGFITFEAFCRLLNRERGVSLRRAFEAFDVERVGELDLRQFIVGLSMYTQAKDQDKLKFAFMLYDEGQTGSLDRASLAELLTAMVPGLPETFRDAHVSRIYSTHNLHPNADVPFQCILEYVQANAEQLLPSADLLKQVAERRRKSRIAR